MKIVSMFCPSEALNSWLCFVQKIAFEQSSCFLVFIVAVLSNIQLTSHRFNFLTSVEPDQAPADVEVWTPHSTRLDVSWNEVPNGYKNGIISGYKIQYTEMMDNGSVETDDLEPWKRSLSITGLKKFTLYNITVLAYTTKGDGASYSKVIMTNQDGMFPLRTLMSRYPMKHCTRVVCFAMECVPLIARIPRELESLLTSATLLNRARQSVFCFSIVKANIMNSILDLIYQEERPCFTIISNTWERV